MTTQILCGFETGDTSEASATSGTLSVQNTTTRGSWSAYALRTNPTTTAIGRYQMQGRGATGQALNNAVSNATGWVRFYFRVATLPAASDEEFFNIYQTGGTVGKLTLRITSAGKIAAYDGTPTLITTGTAVLSTNTWYRIEVNCGTGVGAVVEWKVDGTTDVSTTATLSANNNGGIGFGKGTDRNGNSVDFYFDDALYSDTAYPGVGQVTCLLPSANGNYQTWTIGAGVGSHWQIVDERPPDGNTSYLLSTLTAGNAETEALTDSGAAGVSGTVNSVLVLSDVTRDGAAGGLIKVRLRSGSTDTDTASNFTTTAAYLQIGKYFDTDPATTLAWTTGGLDGCETGVVEQSAANKSRITWTGLMVDYTPGTAVAQFQPALAIPGVVIGGGVL